jgi:hypothetical protein
VEREGPKQLAQTPRYDFQYDGDRRLLRESREGSQCHATKRTRPGLPPSRKGTEQQQPSLPSISSQLPLANQVSPTPSQLEKVFSNIDHEFVSEAPFLIEDRLKDLFANFLTELSGKMETFPGTLLESCVARLNSTISTSVQNLVRTEILPSLFEKIMNHVSEFSTPPSKNAHVDSLVSDKLDSLQDIIVGMNSVQEDKIDKLSTNFAHMEDQLREQVMDLKHKLLESKNREEELLEQMKRRIGDISSISSSLNYKIDKCLAQEKSKSYEPQVHKSYEHQVHNAPQSHEELNLHYNNPFMNQHSSHIHPEKQDFKHQR